MEMSTYLSQLDATAVAVLISAGAIGILLASLLLRSLRKRSARHRFAVRVTAASHRAKQGVNLLEEEMRACLARAEWNERQQCWGTSEMSSDRQRANEIAELLQIQRAR